MKKLLLIFISLSGACKAQDSTAHRIKQHHAIRTIYNTGCDEVCQKLIIRWDSLHKIGSLNNFDFEDLLEGEKDLMEIKKLTNKTK